MMYFENFSLTDNLFVKQRFLVSLTDFSSVSGTFLYALTDEKSVNEAKTHCLTDFLSLSACKMLSGSRVVDRQKVRQTMVLAFVH